MNCLQSLVSQFKLVADTAIGELTLLADLQDVSHSHAPPWVGIQEKHNKIIQKYRPYPFCCREKGHGPCANNIIASELSHIFPEEVTFFKFEYSLCSSADAAGKRNIMRNGRPCLDLRVFLVPHYVHEERLQASYAAEVIGDSNEECIDVSIQQMGETRQGPRSEELQRQGVVEVDIDNRRRALFYCPNYHE
ncbi:hypothetical protein C2845_PM18G05990 [Panicum miliaceum]|uniref:Uncharacterized protein n=1 Tax=Panicum miliaceum TaxID=4540 RepID=A0A3L6PLE6_PANMI|nr:hypothetical protein C2845_PM18G05990 [Panicum miliaceum]